MRHLRPVDFSAYRREGYEFQYLYNGESAVVIGSNVPAGAAAPPHHTHPVDQLYYVVSGAMHVALGSEEHFAGPDTLVFIPAGVPHHNWNAGTVDEFHFEVLAPAPVPGREMMTPTDSTDALGLPYLVRPATPEGYVANLPGFAIQKLLESSDGSHQMTLYVATVEAGAAGPGLHVHEFDQFYYVLEGTISIEVGLASYRAGPHTLVVLPAGVPHRQWNDGPDRERHLTLIAPEPPAGVPWDVGVEFRATGVTHE